MGRHGQAMPIRSRIERIFPARRSRNQREKVSRERESSLIDADSKETASQDVARMNMG
jgi:hypothetical protein